MTKRETTGMDQIKIDPSSARTLRHPTHACIHELSISCHWSSAWCGDSPAGCDERVIPVPGKVGGAFNMPPQDSSSIVISYLLPLWICKMALLAGIVLLLCVYHFHKSWYKETFGPLLRQSEQNTLPGAFWFLVGTWITATCFDTTIGRYAVLCLSYADPVAAWVGLSLPSPRVVGTATVTGCCACFLTALIIGMTMLLESDHAVVEIGLGALACTLAEAFPMGNDNLLIPIATASVVQFARTYL
jgi:dolichol kinase